MAYTYDPKTHIHRDIRLVHPAARQAFSELANYLSTAKAKGDTFTEFRVFETYRSPVRQQYLFDDASGATKAQAWESAHNFGLAVDFVPYVFQDASYRWSWEDEHDWSFLKWASSKFGCGCLSVPIKWDRGHVEHPLWRQVRQTVFVP